MCMPLADIATGGGLLESLGDPLGTRKRREDAAASEQQNKWAREDAIRTATFAHEKEMAGIGSNRSQLGTGKVGRAPGSGTGTPTSSRGGGRSQSNRNPGQY